MMYDLIRFFEEKEYAEEFLEGNLYMNSLGHFWNLEPAPQKDVAEGVIETISLNDYKERYGSTIPDFFGEEHILFPIMNRIESFKYCHLLCCMLHEYDSFRCESVKAKQMASENINAYQPGDPTCKKHDIIDSYYNY